MAKTTLSVRLLPITPEPAFRFIIALALFTGSIFSGCGSGDGGGFSFNAPPFNAPQGGDASSAPTGPASASLAWDPVGGVMGYIVHYGSQSPGSPGSCTYAHSAFSATPTATVTGLEADTTYYFAVSSYNGLESACSSEVSAVTNTI